MLSEVYVQCLVWMLYVVPLFHADLICCCDLLLLLLLLLVVVVVVVVVVVGVSP